jgi:hypothetical protein
MIEAAIIIKITDWIFSLLLMASFLVASIRKERFNESLQFNLVNIIASSAFIVIAITIDTYGYAVRQTFFLAVSGWNVYKTRSKSRAG